MQQWPSCVRKAWQNPWNTDNVSSYVNRIDNNIVCAPQILACFRGHLIISSVKSSSSGWIIKQFFFRNIRWESWSVRMSRHSNRTQVEVRSKSGLTCDAPDLVHCIHAKTRIDFLIFGCRNYCSANGIHSCLSALCWAATVWHPCNSSFQKCAEVVKNINAGGR
jgi:hypothetical protein